jgi:hypothetical protein
MESALLNFSGHRLSENAREILAQRYDAVEDVPFLEINFDKPLEEQFSGLLRQVKTPLDGTVPITIIPPGHATVAVLLIVFLHGVLGFYPSLCNLQQSAAGQFVPHTVFHLDNQLVRKAGRRFRQEQWDKTKGHS